MEQALLDIFILVLAFWLGWKLRGFWLLITLSANPKLLAEAARQAKIMADTSDTNEARQIRVERVGDCLYLYAEDTDEFLAQGPTLEAALAAIEQRFPNEQFRGHIDRKQVEALGITIK
jgi:hypothetical protein